MKRKGIIVVSDNTFTKERYYAWLDEYKITTKSLAKCMTQFIAFQIIVRGCP